MYFLGHALGPKGVTAYASCRRFLKAYAFRDALIQFSIDPEKVDIDWDMDSLDARPITLPAIRKNQVSYDLRRFLDLV